MRPMDNLKFACPDLPDLPEDLECKPVDNVATAQFRRIFDDRYFVTMVFESGMEVYGVFDLESKATQDDVDFYVFKNDLGQRLSFYLK
jgi:hypothetical protein